MLKSITGMDNGGIPHIGSGPQTKFWIKLYDFYAHVYIRLG